MTYNINDAISIQIFTDHDRRTPGGLKIVNHGSKEDSLKVTVVARLSGSHLPVEKYTHDIIRGSWFTPYIVLLGCTYLSVEVEGDPRNHWIAIPPSDFVISPPQKVVCLGLNKSGTTSFTKSVANLGYRFMEESIGEFFGHEILNGFYGNLEDLLRNPRYSAYEDVPFSLPGVGEKIVARFPEYKYVLTVRENSEKWVNSVLNFYPEYWYTKIGKDGSKIRTVYPGGVSHHYADTFHPVLHGHNDLLKYTWGIDLSQSNGGSIRTLLSDIYHRHNIKTEEMLKYSGVDYLVVDVSRPGEFKRVANWLGHETEIQDFNWENKTSHKLGG